MSFQNPPIISSEIDTEDKFRFTLRTIFAVTASLAMLLWTGMDSVLALMLTGGPLAYLTYGFMAGEQWSRKKFILLGLLAGSSLYIWMMIPRWMSPVELPNWAWGVKVKKEIHYPVPSASYFPDPEFHQVKCYATVDSCLEAAERIAKRKNMQPKALHSKKTIAYNDIVRLIELPKADWFNVESIENGLFYTGGNCDLWIDTDRGVLYYRELDFGKSN